jgi:hypothetical protein
MTLSVEEITKRTQESIEKLQQKEKEKEKIAAEKEKIAAEKEKEKENLAAQKLKEKENLAAEKEKIAAQKLKDKENLAAQKLDKAMENVNEFLSKQEIYYVSQDGKFWIYNEESNNWYYNSAESLRQCHALVRGPLNWEIFIKVMEQAGKNRSKRTYSFLKKTDDILNMMRPQNWLKPIPGRTENTIFFDCVLTALSGSNPDNIRHIKQVIGWKYLHPETWQLPALAFYGKGSAGKNLLCEKILATIFGARNCAKVSFKQVERFNEAIVGKTIVLFDERPARDDESFLKMTIQQPSISIEPKGMTVFEADNTALYIIATNGEMGPVRLEKNGVDRRYSIIKVKETLPEVVMRTFKCNKEEAQHLIVSADKTVFSNPDEVARFLNECIEEAQKLDMHPHALHGVDFEELADTQVDCADDLFKDVFIDYEEFVNISMETLYELYKIRSKSVNPGAHPMSMQNFTGRSRNFLLNNKLDKIIGLSERVNVKKGTKWDGKSKVFYKIDSIDGHPKNHIDNSQLFLMGDFMNKKIDTKPVIDLMSYIKP